jgi:2-amino-4-hydroxy-6-hydroxymethyldihydropteridine diphosphokinase
MHEDAVLIALGSNLAGDYPSSRALLEAALDRFAAAGLVVLKRSSWWRSAAWPDPGQPDYLNAAAIVETPLDPRETLAVLRRIEAAFGRRREAHNAPRTLDLDLIAHGRTVLHEVNLILPHPRVAERLFVIGPLAEIAPDWRHPVSGAMARDLVKAASVGGDAAPI